MAYEEKRRRERAEERHRINTYAPLEKLEEIARGHFPGMLAIGRAQNGLDTMDSDELDFFEVSVWGLKEALIEAYLLGQKEGYRAAEAERRESLREMKRMLDSHEKWKKNHPRKGKEVKP
jgi:hypothetical protein